MKLTVLPVISDAIEFAHGRGAILKDLKSDGKLYVCRQSLSEDEMLEGSTSRELKAILLALRSFRKILSGHKVKCYSENQGAWQIFKKCSMKPDLQDLAPDLYIECLRNGLGFHKTWPTHFGLPLLPYPVGLPSIRRII